MCTVEGPLLLAPMTAKGRTKCAKAPSLLTQFAADAAPAALVPTYVPAAVMLCADAVAAAVASQGMACCAAPRCQSCLLQALPPPQQLLGLVPSFSGYGTRVAPEKRLQT